MGEISFEINEACQHSSSHVCPDHPPPGWKAVVAAVAARSLKVVTSLETNPAVFTTGENGLDGREKQAGHLPLPRQLCMDGAATPKRKAEAAAPHFTC